jgi:hypothetical protein
MATPSFAADGAASASTPWSDVMKVLVLDGRDDAWWWSGMVVDAL